MNRSQSWTNGLKNDVWSTEGTNWRVIPDVSKKRGPKVSREKIPRQRSQMKWTQVQAGMIPPPGVPFDTWIQCTTAMNSKNPNATLCDPNNPPDVMFSPRRFAAGVTFKGYLWVFGGRARENVEISNIRHVGGILDSIPGDIKIDEKTGHFKT